MGVVTNSLFLLLLIIPITFAMHPFFSHTSPPLHAHYSVIWPLPNQIVSHFLIFSNVDIIFIVPIIIAIVIIYSALIVAIIIYVLPNPMSTLFCIVIITFGLPLPLHEIPYKNPQVVMDDKCNELNQDDEMAIIATVMPLIPDVA